MFDEFPEEERPFLEAIAESHVQFGPRHVYADWLEERGDNRAEYLRIVCSLEHAQREVGDLTHKVEQVLSSIDPIWAREVSLRFCVVVDSISDERREEATRALREVARVRARYMGTPPFVVADDLSHDNAMAIMGRLEPIAQLRLLPAHYRP